MGTAGCSPPDCSTFAGCSSLIGCSRSPSLSHSGVNFTASPLAPITMKSGLDLAMHLTLASVNVFRHAAIGTCSVFPRCPPVPQPSVGEWHGVCPFGRPVGQHPSGTFGKGLLM